MARKGRKALLPFRFPPPKEDVQLLGWKTYSEAPCAQLGKSDPSQRRHHRYHHNGDHYASCNVHHFVPLCFECAVLRSTLESPLFS